MSILNATHRESVRSALVVHEGIAATEAEVARKVADNRTAPIEAVDPDNVERTIGVADARHWQFKRGGKSAGCIVAAPTCALLV